MTSLQNLNIQPSNILTDATIPELPRHYRGKVRDNYTLPSGKRVVVASDRLSAFDHHITSVPFKGQALTQIAKFWFEKTSDICPNHVIDYPDPNVVVCKQLRMMMVEIVVRGYLAGTTSTSVLSIYKKGQRQMYGLTFPDGMRDNEKLPQAIITPTSKADHGAHDEPLTAERIVKENLLTKAQWDKVSDYALKLFARGQEIVAQHGLILVDTKYEFGFDEKGEIILADEIHTPDSSRYWLADSYPSRFAAGEKPDSLDKDFIRNWVVARCDPYKDKLPEIPQDVVLEAGEVYIKAFETVTGQKFELPDLNVPTIERIRRNLRGYF
jgi:phosphoribosylaminoimidazole-succinocarboxamide synthase